jgi:hypothetical protein
MAYNTSIIIPYYQKYEEFKFALELNKDQYSLVNEVIIIFDEIIDISNFTFLLTYNINFKLYTNTETHEWRNPAPVINHGLKMASSEYCIILSPETILSKDAIKNLMDNVDENTFCIGQVVFLKESNYHSYENKDHILDLFKLSPRRNDNMIGPVYFGSICCSKANFEKVNYYCEDYINWGGEDNDVRNKLVKAGISVKQIKDVKMIHIEDEYSYNKRLTRTRDKNLDVNEDNLYKKFLSVSPIPNNNQIFIDSLNKISEIIDYSLNHNIYSYYPIVLLAPSYNEENNVKEFLDNVSSFVDGIIVLDDSSTDNTWNLIKSDKLLVKAKKDRIIFDDLQNRNLLLNILENVFIRNNIEVGWFIWLDFDERIDTNIRFIKYLRRVLLTRNDIINIYNLPFVHLWDNVNYNADYPHTDNGVQYHTRLIKNKIEKMPYVINNEKKLHFRLMPYDDLANMFPLLIKHTGRNSETLRKYKYDLYTTKYDSDLTYQGSYEHFLQNNVRLLPYEENKYIKPFKILKSLIPVIVYDKQNIDAIYNNLIFSIKLELKDNSKLPKSINSSDNIVICLIDNPNKALIVKRQLYYRKIKYIGCYIKSLVDIRNTNKLYSKRVNNHRFKNKRTFYIGVLDDIEMGIVEHIDKNNYIYPANDLTDNNIEVLKSMTRSIYKRFNCRDYILVKLVLNNNTIMIQNINPNPLLLEDSIITKSAYCCGISYNRLIDRILKTNYSRSDHIFVN